MATGARAAMAPMFASPAIQSHLAHTNQRWIRLPGAYLGAAFSAKLADAKNQVQQSFSTRSHVVLQMFFPAFLLATAACKRRGSGNASNRQSVVRNAKMWMHGRDPSGVRHVESRKQARHASTIKTLLEDVLNSSDVQFRRIGDDEIQRRIRIDDVIMSKGCRAAYVHVGAIGDKLQQRQVFVWLVRNKGSVQNAVSKRWHKSHGFTPKFFFVESKFDAWYEQAERARKYPELNLNNPFAQVEEKLDKMGRLKKKYGIGDKTKPIDPWGYGHLVN